VREPKDIRTDRDSIREEAALLRATAVEKILRSRRLIKEAKSVLARIKRRSQK
jgi:hypothetical protein